MKRIIIKISGFEENKETEYILITDIKDLKLLKKKVNEIINEVFKYKLNNSN